MGILAGKIILGHGQPLSDPGCQNALKNRKAHYDRSTNGTRIQRKQNGDGKQSARATRHPGRVVVQSHASDCGSRDGLAARRQTATRTNLAARFKPASESLMEVSRAGYTPTTSG